MPKQSPYSVILPKQGLFLFYHTNIIIALIFPLEKLRAIIYYISFFTQIP